MLSLFIRDLEMLSICNFMTQSVEVFGGFLLPKQMSQSVLTSTMTQSQPINQYRLFKSLCLLPSSGGCVSFYASEEEEEEEVARNTPFHCT